MSPRRIARRVAPWLRRWRWVGTTREPLPEPDLRAGLDRAFEWISDHSGPDAGVQVSSLEANAYPEVSGYLIPTLLTWGEPDRAAQYGRWLVGLQRDDGAWTGPSRDEAYAFDTGQILKGLAALLENDRFPEFESAFARGCEWLLSRVEPSGRVTTPCEDHWALPGGRRVPEAIHLYALEPLIAASERSGESRYANAVGRALDYYAGQPGFAKFDTLSHFHAYVLEALVDLGRPELAAAAMRRIANLQRPDGSIPTYLGAEASCTTAAAQYAIIWYKLGLREEADRAVASLAALQRDSGGFAGSYGPGADYFPDAEISWAVKYFLDALYWKMRSSFEADCHLFPESVPESDGRLRAIAASLPRHRGARVLDAGCGKGRFAAALASIAPDAEIYGVDLSAKMLRCVPDGIETRQGSLLHLPFPNDFFDSVYCVEALEHAVRPRSALRELARVAAPGAPLVIVDKDGARVGALEIKPWEQWFGRAELCEWLEVHCDAVKADTIVDSELPEGLFVCWEGRVRRG